MVSALALILVVGASGTALGQNLADPGLKDFRHKSLLIKTVSGKYEEIFNSVLDVLSQQNFPLVNVRDYGKTFSTRFQQRGDGKLPFAQYRIIEFCNVEFALELLTADQRMGVFLPCRIVVYQPLGEKKVVLTTLNPKFLPDVLKNKQLEGIVGKLEKVIQAIFEDVDY